MHRKARFHRVVACVVLLMLAIQLFGMAHHKHAYAETASDCAACSFAQHLPSGLPPFAVEVAPTVALVSYQRMAFVSILFVLSQSNYLIPHAQAPPVHIPSH